MYQFQVPDSESHAMKSFFHWELQQELLHDNMSKKLNPAPRKVNLFCPV